MINILYIADPNSIHDIKWMTWFSNQEQYKCHLISRSIHHPNDKLTQLNYHGKIQDYSIFKPWKNRVGNALLKRIIHENKIDLVHIFYAEPNALWIQSIKSLTPVILTTRGSDILVGIKQFITRNNLTDKQLIKTYRKNLKLVDRITSTSYPQANYITENFEVKHSPSIIRTGLNTELIKEPKIGKKIIFFPRNMQPLYKHEFALDAINLLPEKIKTNFKFIFINKDGANKKYIEKINKKIKSLKNIDVEFKNSMLTDEYYDTLSNAECVVMTPRSDGSPVSGMEAIAAGSKLVIPNLNYDTDLFESAFTFTPNNIQSLVLVLIEAITSEKKTDRIKYIPKVNRANEMKKLESLYLDLYHDTRR